MKTEKKIEDKVVAIIIPVYNVSAFVERCLTSCINQTYRNIRIVIVDDGSSDGSFEICHNFFKNDHRISIIQQKNMGLSSARNAGLNYICGEGGGAKENDDNTCIYEHAEKDLKNVDYVHFLDSDDYMTEDCIEQCMRVVDTQDIDIVWHDHFVVDMNDVVLKEKSMIWTDLQKDCCYDSNTLCAHINSPYFHWAWYGCIKMDLAKKVWFLKNIVCEDILYGMMLFYLADNIFLLDKKLIGYQIRGDSICHIDEKVCEWPKYISHLKQYGFSLSEAKQYNFLYSDCRIILEMENFLAKRGDGAKLSYKEKIDFVRMVLLFRYKHFVYLQIKRVNIDPMNCKEMYQDIRKIAKNGVEVYGDISHFEIVCMVCSEKIQKILNYLRAKVKTTSFLSPIYYFLKNR